MRQSLVSYVLRVAASSRCVAMLVLVILVSSSITALSGSWFGFGSAVPSATGARLGGNDVRTRFVADLTVAVSFNAYVIPDPYRVVIDLPEVAFQLPAGAGRQGRGLVKGYRFGLIDAGRSRVVMDTVGPVRIEKAFIIEAKNGQPARMVIDLLPTDPQTFARLHKEQLGKARLTGRDPAIGLPNEQDGVPQEFPPSSGNQKSAPQQQSAWLGAERPDEQSAPRSGGRHTIVIDPGHGGIDPGAIGKNGTTEKSVALAFAKELQNRLARSKRYNVILTRTGDTFLSLRDRVRIARRNDADLFMAIHADVVSGTPVRGATVYTLSDNASDTEAEALAHNENRADLIAGVDLGEEKDEITGILIDLAQRETKNHSLVFARSMVDKLKPVIEMTNRPVRSAGFRVLKAPDVPSVLLELGYLSSHADEELLTSHVWRSKAATAVADAIDAYFNTTLASTR